MGMGVGNQIAHADTLTPMAEASAQDVANAGTNATSQSTPSSTPVQSPVVASQSTGTEAVGAGVQSVAAQTSMASVAVESNMTVSSVTTQPSLSANSSFTNENTLQVPKNTEAVASESQGHLQASQSTADNSNLASVTSQNSHSYSQVQNQVVVDDNAPVMTTHLQSTEGHDQVQATFGYQDIATGHIIAIQNIQGDLGAQIKDSDIKLPDGYDVIDSSEIKAITDATLNTDKLVLKVAQSGSLALQQARNRLEAEKNEKQIMQRYGLVMAVQGLRTSVASHSYGVDVSAYQGTDMSSYARAGAQFAIIKVSEGTGWASGTAAGQAASAKAHNMMVMGYHFWRNNIGPIPQANYAIEKAKYFGIPIHSYLALDWESETGMGENCSGNREVNTQNAIAWMRQVRAAGYLPMLYSGAYYAKAHFNLAEITKAFPGSLWIASYATTSNQNTANFNDFPGIADGIAIWQFGTRWRNLGVDAGINVLPLNFLVPVTPVQNFTAHGRYIDDDEGGKVVNGAPSKTVKSGTTLKISDFGLPANYHYSNANQTFKITGNGNIDIHVRHNITSVGNRSTKVTRKIIINMPDGEITTQTQTAVFEANGNKDMVTGQTHYGDWSLAQNFNAVPVPKVDGYTPTMTEVPALKVTANSKDTTVTVDYKPNPVKPSVKRPAVDDLAQRLDKAAESLVGHISYSMSTRTNITKDGKSINDIKSIDDVNLNGTTDCSGAVWLMMKLAGEKVPDIMWVTGTMSADAIGSQTYLKQITDYSQVQPGDIIIVNKGNGAGANGHTGVINGYAVDYGITKDSTINQLMDKPIPIINEGGGVWTGISRNTIPGAFMSLSGGTVVIARPVALVTNQSTSDNLSSASSSLATSSASSIVSSSASSSSAQSSVSSSSTSQSSGTSSLTGQSSAQSSISSSSASSSDSSSAMSSSAQSSASSSITSQSSAQSSASNSSTSQSSVQSSVSSSSASPSDSSSAMSSSVQSSASSSITSQSSAQSSASNSSTSQSSVQSSANDSSAVSSDSSAQSMVSSLVISSGSSEMSSASSSTSQSSAQSSVSSLSASQSLDPSSSTSQSSAQSSASSSVNVSSDTSSAASSSSTSSVSSSAYTPVDSSALPPHSLHSSATSSVSSSNVESSASSSVSSSVASSAQSSVNSSASSSANSSTSSSASSSADNSQTAADAQYLAQFEKEIRNVMAPKNMKVGIVSQHGSQFEIVSYDPETRLVTGIATIDLKQPIKHIDFKDASVVQDERMYQRKISYVASDGETTVLTQTVKVKPVIRKFFMGDNQALHEAMDFGTARFKEIVSPMVDGEVANPTKVDALKIDKDTPTETDVTVKYTTRDTNNKTDNNTNSSASDNTSGPASGSVSGETSGNNRGQTAGSSAANSVVENGGGLSAATAGNSNGVAQSANDAVQSVVAQNGLAPVSVQNQSSVAQLPSAAASVHADQTNQPGKFNSNSSQVLPQTGRSAYDNKLALIGMAMLMTVMSGELLGLSKRHEWVCCLE